MAKILIIDDSSFQRKWIAKAVRALGHDPVEAVDGEDGLTKLDSEKPDCITVDLNMPKMDGIGFLTNSADRKNEVPIIVVTADIQDATKKQCQDLGACAFLNKPFRPGDLQNILNDCLGESGNTGMADNG